MVKQIKNVSIPGHSIEKFAGKKWLSFEIREGLPVIDSQLENISEDGYFAIDSSLDYSRRFVKRSVSVD